MVFCFHFSGVFLCFREIIVSNSWTKEKYKTMNLDLNNLTMIFNISMQSKHVCFSHWP